MNLILSMYKKFYSITTKKIFVFLVIALNPLLDVLYTITSKYLELNLYINYNQIIRTLIIFVMFLSIKNIKSIKKIIIYGIILLIGFYINLSTNMVMNKILDLSFYFKLLYGIVAYYWAIDLVQTKKINLDNLYSALIVGTMIVSLTIIVTYFFGIGLRSYAEQTIRWGYKGFFTAQNVVALVNFVGLFIYNFKYYQSSCFKIITGSIVYVVAGIIIGTKGSLLFNFLTVISLFIFYVLHNKENLLLYYKKHQKILLSISLIIMLLTIIFAVFVFLYFISYYKKLDYFSSFYSFLVSGRNIQLKNCIEIFTDNFSEMWKYIPFGLSYSYVENSLMNVFHSYHSLEQDLFAMLLYTGVTGLIYILNIYFNIFCGLIKRIDKCKNNLALLQLISFVLIMIYSFFIGHFLFESLACFFVWIFFSTFTLMKGEH